jgi:prepilin-type N-terminal cleavage/methylation domain-containing protein
MKRKRSNQQAGRRQEAGFSLIELLIVVAIIAILATVAVPKLLKILATGRESAAMQNLKRIHETETLFQTRKQRFGTLKELTEEGLLDASFATGAPISGYIYQSTAEVTQDKFCVQATRATEATASKDYNVDQDGAVRYVESKSPSAVACGEGTPITGQGTTAGAQ